MQVEEVENGQRYRRVRLMHRLHSRIHRELAINCLIELVPLHTLPRTSSGKLFRSEARRNWAEQRPDSSAAKPMVHEHMPAEQTG